MKIAQFAPLAESVPPALYGGIERAVSYLTEELVRQGHQVTLFASGDSRTAAELIACCPRSLRLNAPDCDPVPTALAILRDMRQRLGEFDILHFHNDLLQFPLFDELVGRALTTLHFRADRRALLPFFDRCPHTPLVSISNNQRLLRPRANWLATVYYGIPTSQLRPARTPAADYLAFLGRISPEKGPEQAIEIARRSGMRLKIAAKVGDADRAYFEQRVAPLLEAPGIEFIGEIGEAQKSDFLGNAAAMLFPIHWPEPLGLVMIEALACGTPVIAFRHGSVPEIIEDTVTGFITESVEGALRAVERLHELDRQRIRERFEARFAVARMASEYLQVYESISRDTRLYA